MAWQNSIGMGPASGGGAAGISDAGGHPGQPQGTEYTLQGVMRFLQTEWHRHERERNAWQIERAEMKARLGKLEGDLRTNKKLRESMEKHIKMLENALKRSRDQKTKESDNAETPESAEPKQSAKPSPTSKPHLTKPHNSFLTLENEDGTSLGLKHESERERSRVYLSKCIEEFAYHVFSSSNSHQQYLEEQEQLIRNNQYSSQQPQEVSLADVYAQKQKMNNVGSLGPSPIPNHQPPPVPRVHEVPPLSRSSHAADEPFFMSRNPPSRPAQSERSFTAVNRTNDARTGYDFSQSEEPAEKVAHSYNSYGQPVASREEGELASSATQGTQVVETDGWAFDEVGDETALNEQHPQSDLPPPQRPDTDAFPNATNISMKSPGRGGPDSHRRKTSLTRRRQSDGSHELREINTSATGSLRGDVGQFKVKYALRGHLDVIRSVIFTGGGSPSAPEICTAGDDGVIKRWIATSSSQGKGEDLDLKCEMTHRGHTHSVLCLAANPVYQPFTNGGRAVGDGWVFSGGQDASVRVWERGRVDPKATLDGHTDAVWTICVLPGTSGSILGMDTAAQHGGPDRTILASGAADGTILVWVCSSPPTIASPHTGSRRGTGGSRRANSVSSGSNFPNSPQPNANTAHGQKPFAYSLVHSISPRRNEAGEPAAPTCIAPLSATGETFVVSFNDASVIVFDTKTGEEIIAMASQETYDGTTATGINAVVATTMTGMEGMEKVDDASSSERSRIGVGGLILSGHEDRVVRFFDAGSGQNTYSMLAHPSPISSLSLSPSATELVSAGHDASLRFWSLEKRACVQEVSNAHRMLRGEGVTTVVWSQDGRWVVSGGGDGSVKVFARVVEEVMPPDTEEGRGDAGIGMAPGTGEPPEEEGEGWRF